MAPDAPPDEDKDRAQLRILLKGPKGIACRLYVSLRRGAVYAGPYDFGGRTLTEARAMYERSRAKVRLDRLREPTLLGMWSLSARGPSLRWDYTPRPDTSGRVAFDIDAEEHPLCFVDLWAMAPDDNGQIAQIIQSGGGNVWSQVIAMARIEQTNPRLLCRIFELDQNGEAFVDEILHPGRTAEGGFEQRGSGLWVPGRE